MGDVILLDTCTFLWLADPTVTLPGTVTTALRKCPSSERYVSAISAFEIGYKDASGKLSLPKHPKTWFAENCALRGIQSLPINDSIALRASQLPRHHPDPADRLIISTALEYGLTILTPDKHFAAYSAPLLWEGPK